MAKIVPITEHYQHFLAEMKESFWGDVYGETKRLWKERLEADSQRQRDRYAVREVYQRRSNRRQPYRNGGLQRFQRRAEDVSMLIREAFLRGISTPAGGTGGGHPDRRSG